MADASGSIELAVAEAPQRDVGLGRARIDEATRRLLEVGQGDAIELIGRRSTVASMELAAMEDEGKHVIRIDGLVRSNAKVATGDTVIVRKAVVEAAQEIALAPVIPEDHRVTFGEGIEGVVKLGLMKRYLTRGDVVIVRGMVLTSGALPFAVVHTKPERYVCILNETVVIVRNTPFHKTEDLASEELHRVFTARLTESLSNILAEFGDRVTRLEGDMGDRARSLMDRVRELLQDLRREENE